MLRRSLLATIGKYAGTVQSYRGWIVFAGTVQSWRVEMIFLTTGQIRGLAEEFPRIFEEPKTINPLYNFS